MHQSYLRIIRVIALQILQMPGDGIHQRTVKVTTPRMHHHSRRLIDYHQVIVFIDHIQRDILRFDGRIVVWTVEHECDDISCTYLIITLDR